jgi:hypothetical protein
MAARAAAGMPKVAALAPAQSLVILTVAMSAPEGTMQHCPRCMSRTKRMVDLFVSAHPRGRDPLSWSDRPWLAMSKQRVAVSHERVLM